MSDSPMRVTTDLVVAALQEGEIKLTPSKAQSEQKDQGGLTEVEAQAQNLARAYEIVLDKVLAKVRENG